MHTDALAGLCCLTVVVANLSLVSLQVVEFVRTWKGATPLFPSGVHRALLRYYTVHIWFGGDHCPFSICL